MPGDLSAAVDVDDRRAVGGTLPGLRALAGRVDRAVLEQQHRVGSLIGRPGLVHRALLGPRLLVWHGGLAEAEMDECQTAHPTSLRRRGTSLIENVSPCSAQ